MTPEQIRSLREFLGDDRPRFAERIRDTNPILRCNQQTVYRWEGGTPARRPDAHSLAALAAIREAAIRAGYVVS